MPAQNGSAQNAAHAPEQAAATTSNAAHSHSNAPTNSPVATPAPAAQPAAGVAAPAEPRVEGSPRSGVHIISFEERDGVRYYTLRDLRNNIVVRNVTQKSARDLWLYAINQVLNDVYDTNNIPWTNDRAVLSRSQRAGKVRYDLALRDATGKVVIFYGVSDDGMDARWKDLVQATMPPAPEPPPQLPSPAAMNASALEAPAEPVAQENGASREP